MLVEFWVSLENHEWQQLLLLLVRAPPTQRYKREWERERTFLAGCSALRRRGTRPKWGAHKLLSKQFQSGRPPKRHVPWVHSGQSRPANNSPKAEFGAPFWRIRKGTSRRPGIVGMRCVECCSSFIQTTTDCWSQLLQEEEEEEHVVGLFEVTSEGGGWQGAH